MTDEKIHFLISGLQEICKEQNLQIQILAQKIERLETQMQSLQSNASNYSNNK